MRNLSVEETKLVSGGDAQGDAAIAAGNTMMEYGAMLAIAPHPYARAAAAVMVGLGYSIKKQGEAHNAETSGGSPGGGGGGAPGGGTPGGSGGGTYNPPHPTPEPGEPIVEIGEFKPV